MRTHVARPRRFWLRLFFVALIAVGITLVLYPLLPLAQYSVRSAVVTNGEQDFYLPPFQDGPTPASTATTNSGVPAQKLPAAGTKDNRIIIPKIGVNMPIVEGSNEKALDAGAWRLPQTSADPRVSNMAISAHRFRYKPPSSETFYLLDKLAVDDTFLIEWEGVEYSYRVTETKVVLPGAIEVLNPTLSPVVTLITCTPLFSTSKRLIIVGTLVTPSS